MKKLNDEPKNPLFSETQKTTNLWIILLVAVLLLISIWAIVQQNILDKPFGNNPAPDWLIWLMPVIPLLLLLIFMQSKMITFIDKNGIWFKYLPFHAKYRFYPWDEINSAYIREYKPMKEFAGYGIRTISPKGSIAYSVKENIGLQLSLQSGKRLLIGTSKPDDIQNTLEKLNKA
ncbi:MAG: DUF6141 family protein [Bacteroidota bacterium]